MDRLILVRHGDAERDSATGDDFDRRLSSRGREESARMGETLAELGMIPDLALVSGAVRTRESWAAMSQAFPNAEARFEDPLYLAEAEVIRRLAEAAGKSARTVLVVGHNPGLQELAVRMMLDGGTSGGPVSRAQSGFPTGGAAVFLIDSAGRPHYDGLFYPRDRT